MGLRFYSIIEIGCWKLLENIYGSALCESLGSIDTRQILVATQITSLELGFEARILHPSLLPSHDFVLKYLSCG